MTAPVKRAVVLSAVPVSAAMARYLRPGDTVVAFCLAIGSTLSECQTLLRISRHALLDPRFHRDGALIFALERGIGLSQCNDLLFDIKENTL